MPAKKTTKTEATFLGLNVQGHEVKVHTDMTEDQIDEGINFAIMCHQKIIDMKAEYKTPNEQFKKENEQLVLDNKTLTYNIEVQTMLLMYIKSKIGVDAYEQFKSEVLESDEFKKLKSRNGL